MIRDEISHDYISVDSQWNIITHEGKKVSLLAEGFTVMGDYVTFVTADKHLSETFWRPVQFGPRYAQEGRA